MTLSRAGRAGAWAAAIGIFLLAWSGLTFADLGAREREDREEFIALLRLARRGDSDAQWQVARTYVSLGEYARAIPFLQTAAEAGEGRAASLLAGLHEDGRAGRIDPDEALRWYRRAAELKSPSGMAALARLLASDSSESVQSEADALLSQSAALGDPDGQYLLGLRLLRRKDVEAEAADWLSKAAEQGHPGAQIAAALQFLSQGEGKGRAQATQWLAKAAAGRDPVANWLLSQTGPLGRKPGDKHDADSVRAWLTIAAQAGHREAQFVLGTLLAKQGDEVQTRDAANWLEKAYRQGHLAAANRLGELYRDGPGALKAPARAREIFLSAAEKGNSTAMYNLAGMLNAGIGGERNTAEALRWYSKAAEAGHAGAKGVVEDLLGSSTKTSDLGFRGFWQK